MFGVRGGRVRGTAIERGIAAAGCERGCVGSRFTWWRLTPGSKAGGTSVIVYLTQCYVVI